MEVLTIDHPRFPEFIKLLSHEVGDGCSGCFSESIKIMEQMGSIDVAGTLENFRVCGESCDCQVLAFVATPEISWS
jgi:hypothetical protein